ncbi:MAG: DNA repair protein RadC, partial [Cyclobacteriaceae bacterium]
TFIAGSNRLAAAVLGILIFGGVFLLYHVIGNPQLNDLKKFRGIGEAKAISIVSALELGRRRRNAEPQKKYKISSSRDVYELMRQELLDETVEFFFVLFLNRNNLVIKKQLISQGGTSATIADPKLIFKYAMESLANALILVHNHPSGNLKPSDADVNLTKKLCLVGKNLDLPVLDHVIFTDLGYFSFADEGMI